MSLVPSSLSQMVHVSNSKGKLRDEVEANMERANLRNDGRWRVIRLRQQGVKRFRKFGRGVGHGAWWGGWWLLTGARTLA